MIFDELFRKIGKVINYTLQNTLVEQEKEKFGRVNTCQIQEYLFRVPESLYKRVKRSVFKARYDI